jgi:hypothetical protein
MDSIRTLLLARTHTVVLDPDRSSTAATRPARDEDVGKLEAELAQLGFVMSLDLALAIRRLPHQTILEMRSWIVDTLTAAVGKHRPQVPLFRGLSAAAAAASYSLYARRILTWLATQPEQPCPWCGRQRPLVALDPCGHLVCRACWGDGNFAGCAVCHRRVSPTVPFVPIAAPPPLDEQIQRHGGELRLVHLGFDVIGTARIRFDRMLTRPTPLASEDRLEIETMIDAMGPKASSWLPPAIPVRETMAIAIARLWMVAADRSAMVRATQGHLRTALDVLRVAAVLMRAPPALTEPIVLRSMGRALRRAVLEALERLPVEHLLEEMARRPALWKRVGERLHPFERAGQLQGVATAFAALRATDLSRASFGELVIARAAPVASLRLVDHRLEIVRAGGTLEAALRAGDGRRASELLAGRATELVRRADHLTRVTAARQPDALAEVVAAIGRAMPRAAASSLVALAHHAARRSAPWPRRVTLARGDVLRPWGAPDLRAPLPAAAARDLVARAQAELLARAEARSRFPRAVLDQGLRDVAAVVRDRARPRPRLGWPRGSARSLPAGDPLRVVLHWAQTASARVALDLAVVLYDAAWRHVATCDSRHPAVPGPGGEPAAAHLGDRTSAPGPAGAAEIVQLALDSLAALGARHAIVAVTSRAAVALDRLPIRSIGVVSGIGDPLDPGGAAVRFDLRGRARLAVPLALDLEARTVRWLDLAIAARATVQQRGGLRALLAQLGRDFADLAAGAGRPTLWELACLHASARANTIYVRGDDGLTTFRRRDGEPSAARYARLLAGEHDGRAAAIPAANAPTWLALLRDDLPIPAGSAGFVLDARGGNGEAIERVDVATLVAELIPTDRRPPA